MNNILIIAEGGVNHNGDLNIAKEMVDAAAASGVDVIKFQTFKASELATIKAPKAEYQSSVTGKKETQYEMLKKLELNYEYHYELLEYCVKKNIIFISTAFDLLSIDFLKKLNLNFWKIPSGEITNLPYLKKIGSLNNEVILSTGMSYLFEVGKAIDILMESGTCLNKITLLHCNTEYPTLMKDVNLNAMNTLKSAFPGVKTGYSDHTLGIEIPIAAAALGAAVIEKHFTLDKI